MITDYTSLKASIAERLHRSDLTSLIPEFIADAEARIYNDLRIQAMEESYSQAIASGVAALPTGFMEWKFLYVDASSAKKLTRKDAEWIYTNYPTRSAEGTPVFFAREGSNLIFGPYPTDGLTVKGVYYKRPAALSDSNTTNWLIENAPDLLRYAALTEAAVHTRDAEAHQVFDGKTVQLLRRVQKTDDQESFSGSVLSVTKG